MDCTKCNLRYNEVDRQPLVHQCGHTLCQACAKKTERCKICQTIIDRSKSIINYSLMQMLLERKASQEIDKIIKVCFVGESEVGKTSLINRLKGNQFRLNTVPTIGIDFAFATKMIDGLAIKFQLWDSAGQERFKAISPLHYKNSDIAVIVYDVTLSAKDNKVKEWFDDANSKCPENTVKILVGNKIDLIKEMKLDNLLNNPLNPQFLQQKTKEKIVNFNISCKTSEGVQQLWSILESTVRFILKRPPVKNPLNNSPKINKPISSSNEGINNVRFQLKKANQSKSSGSSSSGCWC